MGAFAGSIAGNGYLTIPVADENRGSIVAMVEWGALFPGGGLDQDTSYSVTWPAAFPNACIWALATLSNSKAKFNTGKLIIDVVSFTRTAGIFQSDFLGAAGPAHAPNDRFYCIAIGF